MCPVSLGQFSRVHRCTLAERVIRAFACVINAWGASVSQVLGARGSPADGTGTSDPSRNTDQGV
jgi:hypothetical protein